MTFVLLNSLLKEEKYIYNFEAVITIIFKIIYRNKKNNDVPTENSKKSKKHL